MQRNWIGRSQGAHIDFSVEGEDSVIGAFTTRPDTIFGVTFVTLSPEHFLCESLVLGTEYEEDWRNLRDECAKMSEFERINMLKEKKGVSLGRFAVNPLNGDKVPIYAGNFVVASYGTGAVVAVPDVTREIMTLLENIIFLSNQYFQETLMMKPLSKTPYSIHLVI